MQKIVVDFGDLENDLKNQEVELLHCKQNSCMYLKDKFDNIFEIEKYYVASYLDRMKEQKAKATFYKCSNKKTKTLENKILEKMI